MSNTSRFFAYSNYIVATSRLMRQYHVTDQVFADNLQSMSGFGRIKHRKINSTIRIEELLRNSWFTEVLLREARKYPDFLPFSNPWAMVQAYYSIYLTIRAYFLATNRVVATTHRTTLNTICSDLVGCKNRFPEPWRSIINGDTKIKLLLLSNSQYSNNLILKNALESPYTGDPWQHYFLFLKTTRDRQIYNGILDWKKQSKRARILAQERGRLIQKLEPTSFFDALYRIRARSNYHDVDSFAFGSSNSQAADELHKSLGTIIHCTLFMFEAMIAKSIGKRNFDQIVSSFIASGPGSKGGLTIGSRWAIIKISCL